MISRLSTFATAFAVLATTALALTAEAQQRPAAAVVAQTKVVRIVELPRVVVIGHRVEHNAN